MGKEVLFEEKNLRLEYSVKGNYLLLIWGEVTTKDYFKEKIDQIMEICEKKKIKGFFVDTVKNKGISPESQDYAAKKIEAYARKAGGFRQAFVVPPDIFSKFSVDSYTKKVKTLSDNQVVIEFFEDETKALAWLENE